MYVLVALGSGTRGGLSSRAYLKKKKKRVLYGDCRDFALNIRGSGPAVGFFVPIRPAWCDFAVRMAPKGGLEITGNYQEIPMEVEIPGNMGKRCRAGLRRG